MRKIISIIGKPNAERTARLNALRRVISIEDLLQKQIDNHTIYQEWIERCRESREEIYDFVLINVMTAAIRKMAKKDETVVVMGFPQNLNQIEELKLCQMHLKKIIVFKEDVQRMSGEKRKKVREMIEEARNSGTEVISLDKKGK